MPNEKRSVAKRMLDSIHDLPMDVQREITESLVGLSIDEGERLNEESELCSLGVDYEKEIEERDANFGKPMGILSGREVIDDMTMGFVGGELLIVAAPTSVGKTLFCLNLAADFLRQDKTVAFVTLEMTKPELGSRLKRILGKDYPAMGKLVCNKSDKMDWRSIEPFVRKAVEDAGVEIIFIDHLHYFSRSANNVAEELGKITQEFKYCAIKYNVPIVLISHTRKLDVSQKEVANMNDLRGSSYIAQDADIVLMLNNKEKGDQIPKDDRIRVTLEKNRNRYKVPIGSSWWMKKDGLLLHDFDDAADKAGWEANYPKLRVGPSGFGRH